MPDGEEEHEDAVDDGNVVALERTLSVAVDLHLSFGDNSGDDDIENVNRSPPVNLDAVFAAAVWGLVDAMLPAVCVTSHHVLRDGDLQFARDIEATAPTVDRHGSYLVHKKTKDKPSHGLDRVLKHSLYGNSRAASRVSSRGAQSRVSAALTGSVLAMKMAKLALKSSPVGTHHQQQLHAHHSVNGDPFRITEWNEANSEKASARSSKQRNASGYPGATVAGDGSGGMSSRFSLASGTARTARIAVDYQELRRRDEIARDIETREGREKLKSRIQRKGNLKLKLRSMADPTVSVEREEREAAAKARSGGTGMLLSRGQSRGHGAVAGMHADGSMGRLARMQSVASIADVNVTARSHETTFRPEDYDGLQSELVLMDKRGELMVGENCFLVERKPRAELQHDMFQQSNIQPRIKVPTHLEEGTNDIAAVQQLEAQASAIAGVAAHGVDRAGPVRSPMRQSPTKAAPYVNENPVFEGMHGSFQSYPKIELDPKKTPLAKGVAIKTADASAPPQATTLAPPLKDLPPPTKAKPNKTAVPSISDAIRKVAEEAANDSLETQMNQLMRSTDKAKQKDKATTKLGADVTARAGGAGTTARHGSVEPGASARPTTRNASEERGTGALLKHNCHGDKQLQTLRLRTPAYGNRMGRAAMTLGLSSEVALAGIEDVSELHDAVDRTASLQTAAKLQGSASLPKVSYMREFPSPAKGQIHVISSKAAAALVKPTPTHGGGFPFASLPSVIRGKR